jgi:hypothetical protein
VQLVMGRELGRALCGGKWWASDGMAQLATYATDFWDNTFARLPFSNVLDKLLTILRKPAEDYIHGEKGGVEVERALAQHCRAFSGVDTKVSSCGFDKGLYLYVQIRGGDWSGVVSCRRTELASL